MCLMDMKNFMMIMEIQKLEKIYKNGELVDTKKYDIEKKYFK